MSILRFAPNQPPLKYWCQLKYVIEIGSPCLRPLRLLTNDAILFCSVGVAFWWNDHVQTISFCWVLPEVFFVPGKPDFEEVSSICCHNTEVFFSVSYYFFYFSCIRVKGYFEALAFVIKAVVSTWHTARGLFISKSIKSQVSKKPVLREVTSPCCYSTKVFCSVMSSVQEVC